MKINILAAVVTATPVLGLGEWSSPGPYDGNHPPTYLPS